MACLPRSVAVLLAALVAGGCSGDDSDRRLRTLIAFTKHPRAKPGEVWVTRGDGTAARRLVRGVGPAVSPDGRWVAFHRCGDVDCDLWVIPATGGKARLLARHTEGPEWSPKSDRIVISGTDESGETALLALDPRAGRQVELARGALWGWSVSPSGDEVVYGRGAEASGEYFGRERVNLYVGGIDGGEPRQLTHDGHSGYPVWGPDAIAFARLIPYRGWGRHEIWRIEADGTGRRTITGRLPKRLLGSGITGLVPVAWSEDGNSLLAELTAEFGGPPYAVDPKSGAIREIGDVGFSATPAALSRDGRFVLVVEGAGAETDDRTRLVIAPYRGGRPKLVATRASWASWNR